MTNIIHCFNNAFGWCSIASYLIKDDTDISYDEDLCVDSDGYCICITDDELKSCPSFEADIIK